MIRSISMSLFTGNTLFNDDGGKPPSADVVVSAIHSFTSVCLVKSSSGRVARLSLRYFMLDERDVVQRRGRFRLCTIVTSRSPWRPLDKYEPMGEICQRCEKRRSCLKEDTLKENIYSHVYNKPLCVESYKIKP